MRLRKDVNIYAYYPSAKLFQVVVELENVPGALENVLRVLREQNLNILGSFSSVDILARSGVWSGFVEDSQHSESELREKLSSVKGVLDVLVNQSVGGFLVDEFHFPLSWNTGDRAVLMRCKFLVRMFDRVRESLGSGGETVVYEEGFAYGLETWRNFVAGIGEEFARANWKKILMIYQATGWFKLESAALDSVEMTFRVSTSSSFECGGRKYPRPFSQFIRGHLCGALTAIMGREMVCEEVACVATGSSECQYVLKPGSDAERFAR